MGMIIRDSGQKYVLTSHSSRVSQSARVWFTWGTKRSKSRFVLDVKRKVRSETQDKERKEIVER